MIVVVCTLALTSSTIVIPPNVHVRVIRDFENQGELDKVNVTKYLVHSFGECVSKCNAQCPGGWYIPYDSNESDDATLCFAVSSGAVKYTYAPMSLQQIGADDVTYAYQDILPVSSFGFDMSKRSARGCFEVYVALNGKKPMLQSAMAVSTLTDSAWTNLYECEAKCFNARGCSNGECVVSDYTVAKFGLRKCTQLS